MSRGEVSVKEGRKTRSDKKRDIKPTISQSLKNCIYQLSYITNQPVKDIGEILCIKGLKSRKVIEYLSQYFRRDFQHGNTLYMGDFERESLQRKNHSRNNERISIRFTSITHNQISSLAYALDVTPSKATALLLDASIKNTNLLNSLVKLYLHDNLDNNRMRELKLVLTYINHNNPYEEKVSWFSLLALIYDEFKDNKSNLKRKLTNWIDKYKK